MSAVVSAAVAAVAGGPLETLAIALLGDALRLGIQLLGTEGAKAAADAIFFAEEHAAVQQADALAAEKFGTAP